MLMGLEGVVRGAWAQAPVGILKGSLLYSMVKGKEKKDKKEKKQGKSSIKKMLKHKQDKEEKEERKE
eukprot:7961597-Prorocentrum_lima.AAC.1